VGIESRVEVYPPESSEAELLARIGAANADPSVHGILVQLPLPPQIRPDRIALAVDPAKDVDALHPLNQGKLALGRPEIASCTPLGILALFRRYRIQTRGRRAVVLGRSAIVGRPMSLLLSQKAGWGDATVTVAHSRSRELAQITREADLVVAAMGSREALTGEMIRPGAVVVDVGMHRLSDPDRPGKERLLGDVHAPSVAPVAGHLSPVPGGVGPLTVTMLLANTLYCYEAARGRAPEPVAFALSLVAEND
jgi:methylenetetrahydrofolate dehydrogenase (NADP+)/methenyltetrahydrofolate cyclohydrolase